VTTFDPGHAAGHTSSPPGSVRAGHGSYRLIAILTALMMVVGGFALTMPVASADSGSQTTTTDDLNLRSGPALNAQILTVIPVGAPVDILGDPENGFFPVSWSGQDGYAYGAYLTSGAVDGGPVTTGGQQGEVNVVDGPVNFRTGPSLADSVIDLIPDGALVALTGDSANGFVSIIYSDRAGWAHAASVFGTGEDATTPPPAEEPATPEDTGEPAAPASVPVGDTVTGTATVVDGRLNLRTGPGLDYTVTTVMPDGATVELRGDPQNGFLPVSFDGTTGWASVDFLGAGNDATETPTEPPTEEATEVATEEPTEVATEEPTEAEAPSVDGSDGYTEDEIIQVIYAAADRYGQPREDMLRVARCESVLDPSAVNASSGASGLFQFLPSTWATTPYADQDVFDPVANANAAAWMWSEGRRGEWTCQ
jgi:uncharacterized protein YraI